MASDNPPSPSAKGSADQSTTFSLSSLSLKLTTAQDIAPHLGPLRFSTGITSIQLNGNTLGPDACAALAPLLSAQKNLRYVNLADIFTGRLLSEIPPALSSLLEALAQCPKLERVDLSDNAFGLNTVEPLVTFLRGHVPLRHLILNNNGLGPKAGSLVAEALVELAGRKEEARQKAEEKEKEKGDDEVPALETVVCGRNRLESGSAQAWARAYRVHTGVKTVKMVQNGIRPEGVVLLLREGLRLCQSLEVLDLQDNTFTATGARALAGIVRGLKGLKELGVGDCLLKGRGAIALMEALAKGENGSLQVLRLQYAEMDVKGLNKLVAVVEAGDLPGLRRVEINGNRFPEDEEGVVRLTEILETRRDELSEDQKGEDDDWGLDELDDMEEDEEDEDEEDVEDLGERGEKDEEDKVEKIEREKEAETILKQADQEEAEKVAQKKDADVDELADALNKKL